MSDPNPTPAPTIGQRINDTIHGVTDWAKQQEANLAHALASAGFSKPVADLVTTAEDVLGRALPEALKAGEKSLADQLTPEHLQALTTLIGEINAAMVKQFLSRIAAEAATVAVTTAAAVTATV